MNDKTVQILISAVDTAKGKIEEVQKAISDLNGTNKASASVNAQLASSIGQVNSAQKEQIGSVEDSAAGQQALVTAAKQVVPALEERLSKEREIATQAASAATAVSQSVDASKNYGTVAVQVSQAVANETTKLAEAQQATAALTTVQQHSQTVQQAAATATTAVSKAQTVSAQSTQQNTTAQAQLNAAVSQSTPVVQQNAANQAKLANAAASAAAATTQQAQAQAQSVQGATQQASAVGKAGQAASNAAVQISKLGKVGTAIKSSFGQVKSFAEDYEKALNRIGIASAIVPGLLTAMTASAINAGDAYNDMSQRIGMSVQTLSALSLVLEQSGSSLEEFEVGMKTLASKMGETVDPTSEASKAFRILGVNVRDSLGNFKTNEQLLPQIADGFSKMENGAGKTALAVDLFGRAGQRLIPFLNQGAGGIDELKQKAESLGIVMSARTAKAADDFNDTLTEVKSILKGIGIQIASELLPYLTKFAQFLVDNRDSVKSFFYVAAAASVVLSTAILGLKIAASTTVAQVVGLGAKLTGAIVGAGAINSVSDFITALSLIPARLTQILSGLGLVKVAANGAFGLTTLGSIGAVGVIIAGLATTIYAGVKAWEAYKAKQQEALSLKNLQDQQTQLSGAIGKQIDKAFEQGLIDTAQANDLRTKLQEAAKPVLKKTQQYIGFGGTKEVDVIDEQATAEKAYKLQKEVNKTLQKVRQAKAEVTSVSEIALTSETQAKLRASEMEVEIAKKQVELAQVRADAANPGSTQTVSETVQKQQRIMDEIFTRRRQYILSEQEMQTRLVREQAANNPAVKAIKDEGQRKIVVEQNTYEDRKKIEIESNKQMTDLQTEHDLELIQLETDLQSGLKTEQQNGETARLNFAKITNDERLQDEIEITQQIRQLHEQQSNLPEGTRLTDAEMKRVEALIKQGVELRRNEATINRTLTLEQARVQSAIALANADPSNDLVKNNERLNSLLTAQNGLLAKEIALNNEAIASGTLNQDQVITRQQKNIELQSQLIRNNIEMNRQEATNLPQFQSELGFRNRLDASGIATGEREMIAPFKALDSFITGTLQTTFNGISSSISGWIKGTQTWAQVWTQVGSQMIDMVVQLILEYTLFHNIRMMLDRLFYGSQKIQIASTSAVAKSAQMSQAATAEAAGATTTAAYAPAAAAVGVASFGTAAAIGLVLTLGAIAAIIAAFSGAFKDGGIVTGKVKDPRQAFATGGIVRGPGGPKDDKIGMSVRPGTSVLNASAVNYYGGSSFVNRLERAKAMANNASQITGGGKNFNVSSGQKVNILVSNGEAILSPETTAFFGPQVIDAINKKKLKIDDLQFANGGVVGFKSSETIETINKKKTRLEEFKFANGGIVGFEQAAIRMPRFADGGIVPVPTSVAQVNGDILNESLVNVAPTPVQVIVVDNEKKALEALETAEAGRKIIKWVRGSRMDLGIG